jgi:inorganic pyrophosphatase
MEATSDYWLAMDNLIHSTRIVIDRPRGSTHPRYEDMIYPLDYGYLDNTFAGDGAGIDVWIGSNAVKTLTGILCTFDKLKRDAEIKLLIGCTHEDVETIQGFNSDMPTLFIPNPMVEHDLSG